MVFPSRCFSPPRSDDRRRFSRKKLKEAQSYVSPLMFIVIIPAGLCACFRSIWTRSSRHRPILNASLLCKELVTDTYHWNYIAIIFWFYLRVCSGGADSWLSKCFNARTFYFAPENNLARQPHRLSWRRFTLRFPFLAQLPDRLSHAHRQRRDGFQT